MRREPPKSREYSFWTVSNWRPATDSISSPSLRKKRWKRGRKMLEKPSSLRSAWK